MPESRRRGRLHSNGPGSVRSAVPPALQSWDSRAPAACCLVRFSCGGSLLRQLAALTILGLCFGPLAHAQLAEGGARALALGRAGTALEGEVWGEFNPAAWATLERNTADVFASQAFGISELRVVALAAVAPTRYATFAVNARTYGFADYRETRIGLGVARGLPLSASRRIHVGVSVHLHSIAIDGFGSTTTISGSLGAQVDVLPNLRAGLHARNVSRIGRSEEADLVSPLSSAPAIAAGLAYRASEHATLVVDAEKDLDFPVTIRAGVEVWVFDILAVRGGFATGLNSNGGAPARLSGGIGVRLGMIRADVTAEYHETLGLTPAVSVGVEF